VSAVLDTGQIPKADRAEAVRAAVAEHLVPVEIDFAADRGPAAAHIAITDLAELTVWTSTSTAVKVHRTAALTHDDFTPSIFMGLQMTGSCVVVQHGREAILRRGRGIRSPIWPLPICTGWRCGQGCSIGRAATWSANPALSYCAR
jgi:hypothetical protein